MSFDIASVLRQIRETNPDADKDTQNNSQSADGLPEESPASPEMRESQESEPGPVTNILMRPRPEFRLIAITLDSARSGISPKLIQASLSNPKLQNDPRIKKCLTSEFDAVSQLMMNEAAPEQKKPAAASTRSQSSDRQSTDRPPPSAEDRQGQGNQFFAPPAGQAPPQAGDPRLVARDPRLAGKNDITPIGQFQNHMPGNQVPNQMPNNQMFNNMPMPNQMPSNQMMGNQMPGNQIQGPGMGQLQMRPPHQIDGQQNFLPPPPGSMMPPGQPMNSQGQTGNLPPPGVAVPVRGSMNGPITLVPPRGGAPQGNMQPQQGINMPQMQPPMGFNNGQIPNGGYMQPPPNMSMPPMPQHMHNMPPPPQMMQGGRPVPSSGPQVTGAQQPMNYSFGGPVMPNVNGNFLPPPGQFQRFGAVPQQMQNWQPMMQAPNRPLLMSPGAQPQGNPHNSQTGFMPPHTQGNMNGPPPMMHGAPPGQYASTNQNDPRQRRTPTPPKKSRFHDRPVLEPDYEQAMASQSEDFKDRYSGSDRFVEQRGLRGSFGEKARGDKEDMDTSMDDDGPANQTPVPSPSKSGSPATPNPDQGSPAFHIPSKTLKVPTPSEGKEMEMDILKELNAEKENDFV